MNEPITNVEDAVAALGALPMPVGPQQPPFPPAPRNFEEKLRQDVARLQALLAEATNDAHRARRERDLMRERVSEPYGCKHCGEAKRSHGRRYMGSVGVHSWEQPSDEQVKTRMLSRRVARMPLPADPEIERVEEELTGVNLSLWEEEQENARLRLAWESARRDRRALRARLAELEAAPTTVYRAEHPDSGITLGHYSSITAAHQHCETLAHREGNTGLVSWVPDDSDPWSPEELTFFDVEYCDGDDVPVQTCTGYVVTPLELDSEYDEEAGE